ncbi:hypothetical protein BV504_17155 [Halomonas sp. 'Soap Lake |nr:hypothetical protein B2G49_17310 [Halomonas sp. 'Soap Lake \
MLGIQLLSGAEPPRTIPINVVAVQRPAKSVALQQDFTVGLSLLVLMLGFDVIHGSTEPYAADDGLIIADARELFRASMAFG